MKIGNKELEGYCALAPMAGVADTAFRRLCREFGAAYTVSEMVSSKGLTMQDRKSRELMVLSPGERPAGIQLFGDSEKTMAEAAVKAMEFSPDFIDINMGCPAPKIAGNGGGSALLKDPALIGRIVKSVKEAVDVPVTAKIRIGWDSDSINCTEVARIIEASGADAVTVHGRTKAQMYAPPVYLELIRSVKESVKIPVIGNGDIADGVSARKMLDETGCDFLMVGRGALGRPWVFEEINSYFTNEPFSEPDIETRMKIMKRHISAICDSKGEAVGMKEARKHVAWYIKGLRGAAKLRNEAGSLTVLSDVDIIAEKVIMLGNAQQ